MTATPSYESIADVEAAAQKMIPTAVSESKPMSKATPPSWASSTTRSTPASST